MGVVDMAPAKHQHFSIVNVSMLLCWHEQATQSSLAVDCSLEYMDFDD